MVRVVADKQRALIEACQKAGIEVTVRDLTYPQSGIILHDELGRRYEVDRNLNIKLASSQSHRTSGNSKRCKNVTLMRIHASAFRSQIKLSKKKKNQALANKLYKKHSG